MKLTKRIAATLTAILVVFSAVNTVFADGLEQEDLTPEQNAIMEALIREMDEIHISSESHEIIASPRGMTFQENGFEGISPMNWAIHRHRIDFRRGSFLAQVTHHFEWDILVPAAEPWNRSISTSRGWQSWSFIFPNIAEGTGITRWRTSSDTHEYKAGYMWGAGTPTPGGGHMGIAVNRGYDFIFLTSHGIAWAN